MKLGLTGKRALVTGAGRGIGREIARALAEEGARVAVVARSAEDLAGAVPGAGHVSVALDLMAENAAETLTARLAAADFAAPDILVNNLGGTLDVTDPFAPLADWRRVMRLNFEIAVEMGNAFAAQMRARRWGRIVNIASVAAVELNGPASYAAAKAALAAYTRCVGRLLAADGVLMSAVLAGVVRTEGGYWEQMERDQPERVREYLATRCPLGRFGTPREIADMVTFLCSDRASFNPGAVIPIDGGQLRGYAFS